MARLRLGIIGAGSWTVASHLPSFALRRDDLEFVGIARKGKDLLDKIATDWGFSVASENYRDVLDAGLDICLVASPPGLHHEHAKAAMEAGAHVLVEKPVAIAPADAWDLVDTATRLRRHLLVAFGWNYRPIVREAKRLMDDRALGTAEMVAVTMVSPTRELLSNTGQYPQYSPEALPEPRTWIDPALSGGGYGQAQLSHALGLALWLTGLRGADVFSFMSAPLDAPVELHDAISIRYASGAIGTVSGGSCHTNADANKHQLEVRVIGSDGQLLIDLGRDTLSAFRAAEQEEIRPPLEPNAGMYDCIGPPHTLIDLALGREADNCSPGELGARTVELLEAAYRSSTSGEVEHIERASRTR
jgi:predicted dehydrogenase